MSERSGNDLRPQLAVPLHGILGHQFGPSGRNFEAGGGGEGGRFGGAHPRAGQEGGGLQEAETRQPVRPASGGAASEHVSTSRQRFLAFGFGCAAQVKAVS
jgi:hypothetical protein